MKLQCISTISTKSGFLFCSLDLAGLRKEGLRVYPHGGWLTRMDDCMSMRWGRLRSDSGAGSPVHNER